MKKFDYKAMEKSSPAEKIRKEENKKATQLKKEQFKTIKDFMDICYEEYLNGEYKTGTKCGNIIGDRIRYLLKKKKMSIVQLSKMSGIARSTVQSYLTNDCYKSKRKTENEKPKIWPSKNNLLKMLNVLECFLQDFVHSPDNFKKWMSDYEHGYYLDIEFSQLPHTNYDVYKEWMLIQLKRPFTYNVINGNNANEEIPMSERIREVLSRQLLTAFDIVDALLENDARAKGKYTVPFLDVELEETENVEKNI